MYITLNNGKQNEDDNHLVKALMSGRKNTSYLLLVMSV